MKPCRSTTFQHFRSAIYARSTTFQRSRSAICAVDCVLFCWVVWPSMPQALKVIEAWGFAYKTCAFCWNKGNTLPLFPDDFRDKMGLGYWTRAN